MFKRLQKSFSDDDIIYLNNTFATNNSSTNKGYAKNGTTMKVKIKKCPTGATLQGSNLQVEDNNYKQLSNDTIELTGNYHKDGGTLVNYGGNLVEAEKGEAISIGQNGDAIVWGNLEIPGTKMKFKSAAKKIAKLEKEADEKGSKGIELIDKAQYLNPNDIYSFNTGNVLADAAIQEGVAIQKQKDSLAAIQQFILDESERSGKKPERITESMKKGGYVPSYKKGGSIAERHNNPGNIKYADWMKDFGAVKGEYSKENDGTYFAKFPTIEQGQQAMAALLKRPLYKDKTVSEAISMWTANQPYKTIPSDIRDKKISDLDSNQFTKLLDTITQGEDSKSYNWDNYSNKGLNQHMNDLFFPQVPDIKNQVTSNKNQPKREVDKNLYNFIPNEKDIEVDSNFVPKFGGQTGVVDTSQYDQYKPSGIDINREDRIPSVEKDDPIRNKLGLPDFMGEIAALIDRPDYVEGQKYEPMPYVPYQVSFQDRLNENSSTFATTAQQIRNNPEALSVLAAQKYQADNSVLGEQFRTNQGISNQITNQNIGLFNDAQLKNIQLADTQYDRQAKAKAITEDRKMQALSSISNKINTNRATNNAMSLYEKMFNYQQNKNGELQHIGGPASFNFYGTGNNNSNSNLTLDQFTKLMTTRDANGNIRSTRELEPSEMEKNQMLYKLYQTMPGLFNL